MVIAFRIAAAQLALASLGFGIPAAIGAAHLARTGTVWYFLGFPTNAPGPVFHAWGVPLTVGLQLGFVATCALGVVAVVLLWMRGTMFAGAILGLIAILTQAVYWAGFDLPFGPPTGVIAVLAIVVGLVLRARRRSR